ncbi:unnamed protein product [Phytophthora fragariaefolia]|uniref:Unnamed protein product n=1 Tax=Phytophthora fragariaefolia TaxID=1490495 RepID=A0A9W7D1H4_9STRA|nr:unnamed protein product [Phytophthora fragariaefolia]
MTRGSRPAQPETIEGESVQDEPAQASEGSANEGASLEEDRVSDSQLPDQDVRLLDAVPELTEEKPLSTVQEDTMLEDLNVYSHLASKAEVSTETALVVGSKLASSPPDLHIHPGSHDVVSSDPRWSEQATKTYVAREVPRWEQVHSERVYPPSVEFVWPEHHPDPLPWLSAVLKVSKFLDDRRRPAMRRRSFRVARLVRGSEGSSTGEPNSKRLQYHKPREDLFASLPLVLPLSSSSRVESIQDARTSNGQHVDTLPSQVGTTDDSSLVAHRYHFRLVCIQEQFVVIFVVSARAFGIVVGGGEMGFYVTQEAIRERRIKAEVDQDDVEMARSVSTSSAQMASTRTSRTRRKHHDSGRISLSSYSDAGSERFYYHGSSRSRRHSSKRSTKRRSPSRRSSRSERWSVSLRSGRSRAYAMSGTAELTVSTLHKVHETLARLENKTSTDKLAEQEAEPKRRLDEAERRIHEAERRAQEAERQFLNACAQATVAQGVPDQEAPDRRSILSSRRSKTMRGTKLNALPGSNMPRPAGSASAVEAARVQVQETARNMQKASSAETQPGRATTDTDSSTLIKTEVSNPERATWNSVASSINVGQAPDIWSKVGQMNISETAIAQLRATIPNVNLSAFAGRVKSNVKRMQAPPRLRPRHGARTDAARSKQESKDKVAPKPDPKKFGRKMKPSKKKRPSRDLSSTPALTPMRTIPTSAPGATAQVRKQEPSLRRRPRLRWVGSTL